MISRFSRRWAGDIWSAGVSGFGDARRLLAGVAGGSCMECVVETRVVSPVGWASDGMQSASKIICANGWMVDGFELGLRLSDMACLFVWTGFLLMTELHLMNITEQRVWKFVKAPSIRHIQYKLKDKGKSTSLVNVYVLGNISISCFWKMSTHLFA